VFGYIDNVLSTLSVRYLPVVAVPADMQSVLYACAELLRGSLFSEETELRHSAGPTSSELAASVGLHKDFE